MKEDKRARGDVVFYVDFKKKMVLGKVYTLVPKAKKVEKTS